MAGSLSGIRVVEMAGLGPGPFGCMVMADHGADVIRVDRVDPSPANAIFDAGRSADLLTRGRRSIGIDLKREDGIEIVHRLVRTSDVFVEGFRPGVAERLGVGPEECLALNPSLVYARATGWGQTGDYSGRAGHDLNYIALAGALHHFGREGQAPTPPANVLGDFSGGGLLLAFGIAAALVERATSGLGQVLDVAMLDGSALLMTLFAGYELGPRGTNLLDTGAPFYEVYECADGEFVSFASVEPQFYETLRSTLALKDAIWEDQADRRRWPQQKAALAAIIKSKTREQWSAALESVPNLCFAPVLSMSEASVHAHNAARGVYVVHEGVTQPAPAPRFSRTPPGLGEGPRPAGTHTADVLAELGFSADEIGHFRADRVVSS